MMCLLILTLIVGTFQCLPTCYLTFRYKLYFNPEEAGFQIFINSYIEYDYFAGSSIVASGKVSWCLT